MKYTQTNTNTHRHKHPVKTVMSIKRKIYHIKLALRCTYKLILKHSFYIILSWNPGQLNPWIDSIIALASDKNLKSDFEKFSIKANLTPVKYLLVVNQNTSWNKRKILLCIWWSCQHIQAFTTVNLNETTTTIHNRLKN